MLCPFIYTDKIMQQKSKKTKMQPLLCLSFLGQAIPFLSVTFAVLLLLWLKIHDNFLAALSVEADSTSPNLFLRSVASDCLRFSWLAARCWCLCHLSEQRDSSQKTLSGAMWSQWVRNQLNGCMFSVLLFQSLMFSFTIILNWGIIHMILNSLL